ncbi:MAG: Arc family DNA-binding protein [Planctomycetota bacterium]
MSERKPYLLRIPSDLWDELARWAKDDLRSLNAQIEYVLREAVRKRRGGGACSTDAKCRDGEKDASDA